MMIKISCGGLIFTVFNYKEKQEVIEECRSHGFEAEILEVKL